MAEQLRVRQDLALLDVLDSLIAEVEQHLGRLSMTPPWEQQVPFLLQLPGLGMVCAMTILAAVGDMIIYLDFSSSSRSEYVVDMYTS